MPVTREGVCPHRPRIPARIDGVAVPATATSTTSSRHARSGLTRAMASRVSPPAASIRHPARSPTCDAIQSIDMDFS